LSCPFDKQDKNFGKNCSKIGEKSCTAQDLVKKTQVFCQLFACFLVLVYKPVVLLVSVMEFKRKRSRRVAHDHDSESDGDVAAAPPSSSRFELARQRYSSAAQTGELWYRVQQPRSFEELHSVLDRLLADAHRRSRVQDNDLVSVVLSCEEQAQHWSTGLRFACDVDADSLIDQVANVQSNETFVVTEVTFKYVRLVTGGCAPGVHDAKELKTDADDKGNTSTSSSNDSSTEQAAKTTTSPDAAAAAHLDDAFYAANRFRVHRLHNSDNACAARSLVILQARWRRNQSPTTVSQQSIDYLSRDGCPKQMRLAKELCQAAGVDASKPAGIEELQRFADHLRCIILVVSCFGFGVIQRTRTLSLPAAATTDGAAAAVAEEETAAARALRERSIPHFYLLYSNQGHYEPILRMSALVGSRKWCNACCKGYSRDDAHRCLLKCTCCFSVGCTEAADMRARRPKDQQHWVSCPDCFRTFPAPAPAAAVSATTSVEAKKTTKPLRTRCFRLHKSTGVCNRLWKCTKQACGGKLIRHADDTPETHKCARNRVCPACGVLASDKHRREQCFLQVQPLRPVSDKYVFTRLACMQDDQGVHHVNMVVTTEFKDAKRVHQHSSAQAYVDWLLKECKGYTVVLHHGSKYDLPVLYMTLVLTTNRKARPIYRGTRLLYLVIGQGAKSHIRFIDLANWIPGPLSKLPEVLGLPAVDDKAAFFPHAMNVAQHQGYTGALPAREQFRPQYMASESERNRFETWYRKRLAAHERSDDEWDLAAELRAHCEAQARLLRAAAMRFRELVLSMTNQECDPLQYVTIAGTSMAIYRAQHMPAESIASLPPFLTRELRQGLFGGRTNAIRLFWQQDNAKTQSGHYYDVNGLYPFVNATCPYPAGHPTLHGDWNRTKGSSTASFHKRMKSSGKQAYELMGTVEKYLKPGTLAIIQCDVTCPNDLYHPVLPSRHPGTGKLMFDLLEKQQQWYTSVELNEALRQGYKVTRVHKAAVWSNTTTDLFASYIKTFAKLKDEASGFPADVTTAAQKQQYVKEYKQRTGMDLDTKRMKTGGRNEGMRNVSKAFLNNLWGKFCERTEEHAQTRVFREHQIGEYLACVLDRTRQIVDIVALDWQLPVLEVVYRHTQPAGTATPPPPKTAAKASLKSDKSATGKEEKKPSCVTDSSFSSKQDGFPVDKSNAKVAHNDNDSKSKRSSSTNVAIGIFTTAYARLHLLNGLQQLHDSQVLYYDTDSIMYCHDAARPEHKQLSNQGNQMGQWKDELGTVMCTDDSPDGSGTKQQPVPVRITQFASSGPKAYAYVLDRPDRNGKTSVAKVKGFSLESYDVGRTLNADVIREIVVAGAQRQLQLDPSGRSSGSSGGSGSGSSSSASAPSTASSAAAPLSVEYKGTGIRFNRKRKYAETVETKRTYRFTFDKLALLPDLSTRPFGHKDLLDQDVDMVHGSGSNSGSSGKAQDNADLEMASAGSSSDKLAAKECNQEDGNDSDGMERQPKRRKLTH
jgi:hypothetical protein